MKKVYAILFLMTITFFCMPVFAQAQELTYESFWQRYENFNKAKVKDAHKMLDTIEQKATADHNGLQLFKTHFERAVLMSQYAEESSKTTILYLDSMRNKSRQPYIGLYDFIISDLLHNTRLSYGSSTGQTDLHHLDEWTFAEMQDAAKSYLQSAIDQIDTSYSININDFAFMLNKHESTRHLRPNLLDVMIQSLFSRIPYYYPIDSVWKDKINTLFNMALQHHTFNKEPDIVIDYELLRLEIISEKNFTDAPDSSEYWHKLIQLEQKYGSHVDFEYSKGVYFYSLGNYYNEKSESTPYFEQSLNYFQKIDSLTDTSLYSNALSYIDAILHPEIRSFSSLDEYMPATKILFPITYKSIDTLYVTVYKPDRYLKIGYRKRATDIYPYEHFTGTDFDQLGQFIYQKKIILPSKFNYKYNTHTTDLLLDSLPTGNYAILFHTAPYFDTTNILMYKPICVSNVRLSSWKGAKKRYRVFAADQRTGEPLANRNAFVYHRSDEWKANYHNGKTHRPLRTFGWHLSNKNGMFKTARGFVDFRNSAQDYYRNADLPYYNEYYSPKRFVYRDNRSKATIVTDRTLYRPGQTLYFKVLLSKGGSVLSNTPVQITLMDNHYQVVDTITLTSNEFGSVAGQFNLTDKMFGQCLLKVVDVTNSKKARRNLYIYENHYFEVADYKRPTFDISFDPVKEEYKMGDTVLIKGQATSLAGVPLGGATVNLTFKYSNTGTVFNDVTICDAKGHFSYPLKTPISDHFNSYSIFVTASVTDINGETHERQKYYHILPKSLFIQFSGCDHLNQAMKDSLRWIIQARNGEQQSLPVNIRVDVEQLQIPAQYREYIYAISSSPRPSAPLFDSTIYQQIFPQYSLNQDERNSEMWPVIHKQLSIERSFAPDSLLSLNIKDWPTGYYRATVTATDKSGEPVTAIQYFQLYNTDSTATKRFSPLWVEIPKIVKMGDTIPICIGSYLHHAIVICEIFQGNRHLLTKQLHLDQSQQILYVKTTKRGRNEIIAYAHTVQNHNVYTAQTRQDLYVTHKTFKEKNLNISLTHWNKVLEPGSKEHWQIQILHNNSTPCTDAEMLTWMYDFSLNTLGMSNPSWTDPVYPKIVFNKRYQKHHYQYSNVVPSYQSAIYQYIPYPKSLERREYETFDLSRIMRERYGWGAGQSVRTCPGRSVTAYLSDLEGVSSNDAAVTTVRGNRSDGVQTIIDGVRVREDTAVTTDFSFAETADKTSANVDQGAGENPSATAGSFQFNPNIYLRSDFKETAFFYPQLHTDAQGNITFDFTIPDQYTKWQFMAYAHSKDMHTGELTAFIQTRKSLMIQTNCPRFVREGDTMQFQIKVSNLCDTALNGKVKIQLYNYLTDEPFVLLTMAKDSMQSFHCSPKGSTSAAWEVIIPKGLEILGYRVLAQSGHYTDGEENALPVLTNRALMTESMHFAIPGNTDTTYIFKKLQDNKSQTLDFYSYTMEVTANPAWYAIQALPYLIQYRYECNEQLFSKLYANALAQYILKTNPNIEQMYAKWATDSTHNTLESSLTKNEELHNILLEETPWFYAAQRESAQRQQVAKLFDDKTLTDEITKIYNKLKHNQNSDGSWGWFGSNTYSQFITQYIATGYRKLQHIGVNIPDADRMMDKAFRNMDTIQFRRYRAFIADTNPRKRFYLNDLDVQYLYAHSFKNLDSAWLAQPYVQFYLNYAVKNIYDANYTRQAEVALILFRIGQKEKAKDIMEAIRQQAFTKQDQGMFWSQESYPMLYRHYYPWYEAPIERQALFIEAFTEIMHNDKEIDQMKQWLLMQKQGQYWSNTKATTEAIYALLLTSKENNWLTDNNMTISVGSNSFDSAKDTTAEAGTGYLKHVWKAADVTPDLAKVAIHTDQNHPAFGACYWQYFEDMDKITAASDGLYIRRELYREIPNKNGNGTVLDSITANKPVHIGDKITVRMVIKSDRDLEFVQIKDLRAPTFEPLDYREQYVWYGGLSYYACPRDASTNFFITYLPKGTHIIEYQLIANQKGQFSNGVATIECMYAPEFRAQSEGFRVTVK